jgi:hypothetical protein
VEILILWSDERIAGDKLNALGLKPDHKNKRLTRKIGELV